MHGELRINGYVVGQPPNPPLWVAFAGFIAALVASDGSDFHAYAQGVMWIGLSVWGWLELTDGVNAFRRALGAGGLLYVLLSVGPAINWP